MGLQKPTTILVVDDDKEIRHPGAQVEVDVSGGKTRVKVIEDEGTLFLDPEMLQGIEARDSPPRPLRRGPRSFGALCIGSDAYPGSGALLSGESSSSTTRSAQRAGAHPS